MLYADETVFETEEATFETASLVFCHNEPNPVPFCGAAPEFSGDIEEPFIGSVPCALFASVFFLRSFCFVGSVESLSLKSEDPNKFNFFKISSIFSLRYFVPSLNNSVDFFDTQSHKSFPTSPLPIPITKSTIPSYFPPETFEIKESNFSDNFKYRPIL